MTIRSSLRATLAAATAALILGLGAEAARAAVSVYPIPTSGAAPLSIVAGPDGNLWFTEYGGYKVGRITPAGAITEFPVANQSSIGFPTGPTTIVSSGGALWFHTDIGETLDRIATDGTITQVAFEKTNNARGLAASDTGGVWRAMTNGDNHVDADGMERVDPDGTTTSCNSEHDGALAPMTLGPTGALWYSDSGSAGSYIESLTDACAPLNVPISPTLDYTYHLSSMAFSTTGTLWFTEYEPALQPPPTPEGGGIGSYTPGAATATVASTSALGQNVAPGNLVAGPGGTMYFTWSQGVGRIDADGHVSLFTLAGYQPSGLTLGPDGALWFVDRNANSVGRIALSDPLLNPPPPGGGGGGGGGGAPTTKPKLPQAPKVTLTVPRTRLRTLARHPTIKLRCKLAGAGRCTVAAQVPAKVARGLHVKVKKKAKTVTLAHATHTFKRKGTATVTVRFSRALARRIAHRRSLKVTFVATSSSKKHRNRTARKTVTLKR